MVKVYAVSLVLGLIGLITVVYGGALSAGLGREDRDPGRRMGPRGRMTVGALTGFGMAGLSAEFSPLDLSWPLALLVALAGAVASAAWVGLSAREGSSSDAGRL